MTNDNAFPATLQAFLQKGWRFFPIAQRSNTQPLIKEWPELASCDLSQLCAWSVAWPRCNWATLTGEKFFVLDIDHRKSGEAWLERCYEQYGTDWAANTLQVASGGGGSHLYFCLPAFEIRNSAGKIHAGVDVRGWHGESAGVRVAAAS